MNMLITKLQEYCIIIVDIYANKEEMHYFITWPAHPAECCEGRWLHVAYESRARGHWRDSEWGFLAGAPHSSRTEWPW